MTPSLPTSDSPGQEPVELAAAEQEASRRLWGKGFWLGSIVILVALYGGRSLLNERSGQTASNPDATAAITFDAYSNGVNSVLYDAQGNIEYTLEAAEQIHYLDNTTTLQNPFVRLYQANGERWNIVARSGRILAAEHGDRIARLDLSDEVELYQVEDNGNRMTLATPFLSLFPQEETMATEREVTMTTNTLHQTAVGMRADLRQDTLTFLSQVKGRYEVQSSQP
ncbi:MAG: LPS export ABC transporter periplasmic protein LptC [Pseudomonadales bacterium]|nr:LPS export ABC transporter periplasmic protein LptC [Pseudomonadales bacterium]MCP5359034.1 LPS export ABC transporter periplasmic protein LptC [Pseudomonadales bacterium]